MPEGFHKTLDDRLTEAMAVPIQKLLQALQFASKVETEDTDFEYKAYRMGTNIIRIDIKEK